MSARGPVTRCDFDDASDVGSIRYRLHPLDVGFSLIGDDMPVDMSAAEDPLRVSCADEKGERIVLSGSREDVIDELRALRYRVAR